MMTNIVYKYINEFLKDDNLVDEILKIEDLTKEQKKDIDQLVNKIKEVFDSTNSSMIRFSKIHDLLLNNKTYLEQANAMSMKDLMLMITSYIYAPNVPSVDQDTFNELVDEAIKDKDAKEDCWRLAMNYHDKGTDLAKIEDYFIAIRDAYYMCEYISAVDDVLNIDELVSKLLNTKDKSFIKDILDRKYVISILKEKNVEKLKKFIETSI